MIHPIVSEKKVFRLYILVWGLFTILHVAINWWIYSLELKAVLADGLVFNVLMFFIGLSIWYPVLYIDKGKGQWNTFMQFFIAGIVIVFVWFILGKSLLQFVLDKDEVNVLFNNRANIVRGIVGAFQYMLFVLIYYMFKFFNELDEKNRSQEKLNRLLRETELKALKSQMNPHFLFNSLNSISALTIINTDDAREMINKLSEFLRYSLKKNEQVLLPLSAELENVERYLQIEKVRFQERLITTSDVPSSCLNMLLPVMILQPLYENAIKYGVYESIEPVEVRTFCRCLEGDLEISVVNNYDEGALKSKKGEGVGLLNVKDRLQLIYGRTDLLTINKENGYFEVALRIPQNTHLSKE
ncbi:sensor histidine kinase [Carboxylicivirga linearis]|uniref:Histidine kinase n=1 Tax=Carboxylicivirga linearis TaxID=1628157 RepID=A0ABS5JQ25_9BACT|nr:histidine kinase [Carboxylicivirga linearis]MBS2096985.1 histidine kinase [Carboxylicivirga linearis]